jgi:hypothetical protein
MQPKCFINLGHQHGRNLAEPIAHTFDCNRSNLLGLRL